MTFTFPRLSAGIYEVQKNSNTVGFIRKVNATKWIVADVVDTPQEVTKTLKEAKDACMNLIIFNVLDKTSDNEYDTFVQDDENSVDNFKSLKEPTLDPILF
jgi:O-acetyl-ADP-ribose deacetylase (regulator of RNase III)